MPIRNPRGLDFPIVCLVNVRSQLDIDILLDMLEEESKQKIITAEQKGHACNMHFVYYTGNISTNDQRAINDKSMMSDGRSSKLPTRSPALAGNQGAAIKVWNVECEMRAADVRDERRKGVGNGRDENRRMKNERHRKEKKDFY
ncbi:Hypothetical Protein CGB_A0370W [Cryptococcus gattii WM276]|uniref:Uncharacterized protein n=2 Tax=Cryptococcus gattii TaxID=37769 RepID=E6QYZ0_CRYGW|nr:Hypothetical Protein CGB_A0370W [Cryptococcus gattii WM276]ADV19317.1 Hypothetical Protein CGB_A0370W [Cryptococcus gattii WM276]KIR80129.1 hypothetical protein I306_02857 [Cryptococcus gattii EJB2]KJE05179.1 hypothetical protein I311_00855 [Cryptococcus gattii NT-10]